MRIEEKKQLIAILIVIISFSVHTGLEENNPIEESNAVLETLKFRHLKLA